MKRYILRRVYWMALVFAYVPAVYAQKGVFKEVPITGDAEAVGEVQLHVPEAVRGAMLRAAEDAHQRIAFTPQTVSMAQLMEVLGHPYVVERARDGRPTAISYHKKISTDGVQFRSSVEAHVRPFLREVEELLAFPEVSEKFVVEGVERDALGKLHIRLQHYENGVKVYGSELRISGETEELNFLNGRYYVTPNAIPSPRPALSLEQAIELLEERHGKLLATPLAEVTEESLLAPCKGELVYIPFDEERWTLCWRVEYYKSLLERREAWINAHTGAVERDLLLTCTFLPHDDGISLPELSIDHRVPIPELRYDPQGDVTFTGRDLNDATRTIHVWEQGGQYFLIDASKDMFDAAQSSMPTNPVGALITLDAQWTSPENTNFTVSLPVTTDNQWSPMQVSVHYNASFCYDYYRNTHQRVSINGQGGNVISIYNVSAPDGGGLDNAFWNGKAMFYGNGRDILLPLAKALDVAGHEMTHGVIQNTAGLIYQYEPGAINEHLADVFGVMIDREDWQLGEDVVRREVFPSGAMRDMSNPHNGGTGLGHPAWQPKHVNEQYHGENDNGGVHINSGIPNHAFYLFVQELKPQHGESRAKEMGEQVWYRAMTYYLTRSSQFVDLRISVIKAASDLYGNSAADAAKNAFAAVGIGQPAGGGGGGGQDDDTDPRDKYQQDLPINPGTPFFLATAVDQEQLYLFDLSQNNPQPQVIYDGGLLSKPSVTDNGLLIVFVGKDKIPYALLFENGQYTKYALADQAVWRNICVAKDGSMFALLTDQPQPKVYIYSSALQDLRAFDLYNPTTAQGEKTGDVLYADAIEFDYSGQYLMYDALSKIKTAQGYEYEYWDIGFIRVWNNDDDIWGDGAIFKLVSNLPEGISIGNPTFSKNSPYIIAFDVLDQTSGYDQYGILGANIEKIDLQRIALTNTLGFPNYFISDQALCFDNTSGGQNYIAILELQSSKINAKGSEQAFLDGGHWGVFFANGKRKLQVSTRKPLDKPAAVEIYPNPATDDLYFRLPNPYETVEELHLFDLQGLPIQQSASLQPQEGAPNVWRISLAHVPRGMYVLWIKTDKSHYTSLIIVE